MMVQKRLCLPPQRKLSLTHELNSIKIQLEIKEKLKSYDYTPESLWVDPVESEVGAVLTLTVITALSNPIHLQTCKLHMGSESRIILTVGYFTLIKITTHVPNYLNCSSTPYLKNIS
jgi:hypothetical protein